MKLVRRLYDWVLKWADTPYGAPALAVLAFVESSFFPIPPDVLLIALTLGNRSKWVKFALICAVGSVVGGIVGYGIGWGIWQSVEQFFFDYVPGFSLEKFESVQGLYERFNFWIVFVAAFTPIPYKVITITAGVFGINFPMFVIATVVGRSARFFLVGYLLHRFGEPIQTVIDKYFNLLTLVAGALLVGGFMLIEFVL